MHEIKRQRKPLRLKNWDYSSKGYYFVTICSNDRENIFGSFVGTLLACARDSIKLSNLGKIIQSNWLNIPENYKNIELDAFVIMPNHLHGILIISNRAQASSAPTISRIIRSFKSKVANQYLKLIYENNLNASGKIWQRSFHDHIIRNERSLYSIREYIEGNPENWEHDIENLINL